MIVQSFVELYQRVFHRFTEMLYGIVFAIIKDTKIRGSRKNLLIIKFNMIRDELFEFVKNHKHLICVTSINFMKDGKEVLKLSFDSYDLARKFLEYKKFYKFINDAMDSYDISSLTRKLGFYRTAELVPFVKEILNIRNCEATLDDLKMLKDKWMVVNEKKINKKCSVADLIGKIERRKKDFKYHVVSAQRINDLSFILDSATEHYLTNKSCSLCGKDFKFNEEMCKTSFGTVYHSICQRSLWKLLKQVETIVDNSETFYLLLNIKFNGRHETPTEAGKEKLLKKIMALRTELF